MKSLSFAATFAALVLVAAFAPSAHAGGHGVAEIRVREVRQIRTPVRNTLARLSSRPARLVVEQQYAAPLRRAQIVVEQPQYYRSAPVIVEEQQLEYFRAPARLESGCHSAPAQLRARIVERY